jgi:hypothetical protein
VKIIEGMKKLKDLAIKAEDLRKKVAQHCANYNFESTEYPDPKAQIASWIQAHHDILKEILRIRVAIQQTNLATPVSIELGGKHVKLSIAAWIHRRRDLAKLEMSMWEKLGDKGLKDMKGSNSLGTQVDVTVVRHFDPKERDAHMDMFRSEASVIDATLETVNAVTDLI